jgi:DNA/RNA endonuclease G (NUC1)
MNMEGAARSSDGSFYPPNPKLNFQVERYLKYIEQLAIALSVAALTAFSCEKGEDPVAAPELSAPQTEINLKGGSQFISVKASGEWSITVEYSGESKDWISVNPSSGTGNSSSIGLKVSECKDRSERSAVLRLTTQNGSASLTLVQKNIDEAAASGWLELPAVSSTSSVFTHTMKIGSVTTRNYSYQWDYDNLVADWVAYPLSAWTIGTGKRTEAWGLDPYIPEESQPVLYSGYGKGSDGIKYDRGHQCPSADRLTYNSNVKTFYGTNMTPQLNSFNTQLWSNLESKVRSWANSSDTCYVVTGCVTKGSTVYATDNNGKKVTVPVQYYKAVLRYSKNSTFGYSGYAGCAILLDHKNYGNIGVSKTMGMSIDELEEKLGIDFFVNLPAEIGADEAAKVEAQDPKTINWWWQ